MKLQTFITTIYPENGWLINNKKIFPPNAYMDYNSWLSHVVDAFPKLREWLNQKWLSDNNTIRICNFLIKVFNQKVKKGEINEISN